MGRPRQATPCLTGRLGLEAIFQAELHNAAAYVMRCRSECCSASARDSIRIRDAIDFLTNSSLLARHHLVRCGAWRARCQAVARIQHAGACDDLFEVIECEVEDAVAT